MQVTRWFWPTGLLSISVIREMSENIRLPMGETSACSFFISAAQKLLTLASQQTAFYPLCRRFPCFHFSQRTRTSLSTPPGILVKTLPFNSGLNQGAPQRRCRHRGNTRSVLSTAASCLIHRVWISSASSFASPPSANPDWRQAGPASAGEHGLGCTLALVV